MENSSIDIIKKPENKTNQDSDYSSQKEEQKNLYSKPSYNYKIPEDNKQIYKKE